MKVGAKDRTTHERQSEKELLKQMRQGDEVAINAFVQEHHERVLNLCFRLVGNGEVAREVTQEVFLNFFNKLDQFRGQCKLYTWLHRIAVNKSINVKDYMHRRKSQYHVHYQDNRSEHGDRPDEQFIAKDTVESINSALGSMDEQQKHILLLFDLEGYSYKEIAQLLKMKTGTVKSKLFRARSAMKLALES